MRSLPLEPLTQDRFHDFGQVTVISTGEGVRSIATVNERPGAALDLILATPAAIHLPATFDSLESHPRSSQTFIPLGGSSYLVVAATDDGSGAADLSTLAAFAATGDQCVTFFPGTWHRSVACIDARGTFATATFYAREDEDIVHKPVAEFTIVRDEN